MTFLDDEQTEHALKMALAVNKRLEREKHDLIMKAKAEPPPPAVLRKLELDLDKDGLARLVRVVRATIITLEQSREGHLRGKRVKLAQDCEARRLELEVFVRAMGRS